MPIKFKRIKVDSLGIVKCNAQDDIELYIFDKNSPGAEPYRFILTDEQLGHLSIITVQLLVRKTGVW